MKPLPEFERGALVRWSSQARGTTRHHVGVVVLVVPGGTLIDTLLGGLKGTYSLRAMRQASGVRSDKSYLVALTSARSRGKARLHWPHASLLKAYDATAPAP